MFSRRDRKYLHGTCRVADRGFGGEPYSKPKYRKAKEAAVKKLKAEMRSEVDIPDGEIVTVSTVGETD